MLRCRLRRLVHASAVLALVAVSGNGLPQEEGTSRARDHFVRRVRVGTQRTETLGLSAGEHAGEGPGVHPDPGTDSAAAATPGAGHGAELPTQVTVGSNDEPGAASAPLALARERLLQVIAVRDRAPPLL